MTKEMIEKAKQTKTAEELFALAKENDMNMTEEEAKAYFEQLHAKTGELSDDELDDVSGGTTCYYHNDYPVTTVGDCCDKWTCETCGIVQTDAIVLGIHYHKNGHSGYCVTSCDKCKYCHYEDALWLCKHPEKKRG